MQLLHFISLLVLGGFLNILAAIILWNCFVFRPGWHSDYLYALLLVLVGSAAIGGAFYSYPTEKGVCHDSSGS